MAVQFIQGLQSKVRKKGKHLSLDCHDCNIWNNRYLIIRLPHPRVVRLITRSIILALFFAVLPILKTTLVDSSFSTPASSEPQPAFSRFDVNLLTFIFRDLTNEGLYKMGNKAVFVGNGYRDDHPIYHSTLLRENNVDIVSIGDSDGQGQTPDGSYDLAFSYGFQNNALEFIDQNLKVGGISIVQLSDETPSFKFNNPSNFKIVYFRRLQYTILAMRKTVSVDTNNIMTQRKLLSHQATEERKAALNKLEDVLLEPPRAASGISRTYLKKTRYLPDLLGDSLESYVRRVFIDVGLPEKAGGSGTEWFAKHYPTRNLNFEMYKIETVTEESSGKEVAQVEEVGVSDWLRKNVREEEYVVMKAKAEVVEELMKNQAIRLVDELFMECKPSGHGRRLIGSKRAYWECLALYGRLRDEGVAVHQWWG